MYKYIITALALVSVGLWCYLLGTLTPAVVYNDSLTPIYERYNYIKMYEDGSYEAETIDGVSVTGCVETAICNNQ